jgi:hypothetical protein
LVSSTIFVLRLTFLRRFKGKNRIFVKFHGIPAKSMEQKPQSDETSLLTIMFSMFIVHYTFKMMRLCQNIVVQNITLTVDLL